jgi:hypothetical protein
LGAEIVPRIKALAVAVFLFLAIPGSGQAIWDGLPFSTRTEFASLLVFVATFGSRDVREILRTHLARLHWHNVFVPALLVLAIVKLLTFAWVPLGSGFEACYRSIYQPLEDPQKCEKSFEAPFVGGLVKEVSRVEPEINFGRQMYDWRLPFLNEFHRFPVLWISRFPFTAKYEALIHNDTTQMQFIPIRAIGDLSVRVNGTTSAFNSNYDRHYLLAAEVPPGTSKVRLDFKYRDDSTSRLPDVAPTPRGPYAQLKVGELETQESLLTKSRILVTVDARPASTSRFGEDVEIRDRSGRTIALRRENAAAEFDGSDLPIRSFSSEVTFAASETAGAPLKVLGLGKDGGVLLATLDVDRSHPFRLRTDPVEGTSVVVSSTFIVDSERIVAMRPGVGVDVPALQRTLSLFIDMVSFFVLLTLCSCWLLAMRWSAFGALLVGGGTWVVVGPFYQILPPYLGGGRELVIPYLVVAMLFVAIRRQVLKNPLGFLGPTAVALASQKVFDHVYYNHPGEGENWWGKLIYFWRDSDWYVNHGNARAVFVDDFLRGGESVFYARAAPRYLIAGMQILLGENDILIGLISSTVGFMLLACFVARLADIQPSRFRILISGSAAFVGLIFLGDQIITAFAFLVTSEYISWVGLLGVTVFLMGTNLDSGTWALASITGVVAALIHFRPNLVFVCILLFLVLISRVYRQDQGRGIGQLSWPIATYVLVAPLALIHNLYYGGRFVPFTENHANVVADHKRFYWTKIWQELGLWKSLEIIWEQLRSLLYWGPPGDPSYAIFFWGAQSFLVVALGHLALQGRLFRVRTLLILLPLAYIIPMLSYNLTSYYPRHIVSSSLLCYCVAGILWRSASSETDNESLGARLDIPDDSSIATVSGSK